MEKPISKIFLGLLFLSAAIWIYGSSMKNYRSGTLLKFGTIEYINDMDVNLERAAYHSIAENSVIAMLSYPIAILSAIGYVVTTPRSFKQNGWLLMSAILFFAFIPVEAYCYWLDWKIVGLNYWGNWPLEEFRKALQIRLTALAGLPFIAQLCYYTIPILIIFKPLQKQ
jgi:hypothetical protein